MLDLLACLCLGSVEILIEPYIGSFFFLNIAYFKNDSLMNTQPDNPTINFLLYIYCL